MPSEQSFPTWLAPAFAPSALADASEPMAALDARAAIVWVNAAWDRFGRENGATYSLAQYPTYFDAILGPLRSFYEGVFAQARATGAVFEHDYECSSPEVVRHFRMRVLPFPAHGYLVEHTPIDAHPRAPGEPAELPDEARFLDEHGHVHQCSNCRRVRVMRPDGPERWSWVPTWAARSHPRTSHGICAPCLGYYWRRGRRGA